MIYHAILTSDANLKHYIWNSTHDRIVKELVIPFLNKQFWESSRGMLVNLGGCTSLSIFCSKNEISVEENKEIPKEFSDDSLTICTGEIISEARIHVATPDVKSILQQALATPKNQVFVIMKFGDEILDSAYKGVIKPLAKEYGINVIRIDEIQDSGVITDQILQSIAESKYVIADLSGERQNCYYETGFAHALGKEIILTIRDSEPIHFDLSTRRFIIWKTESDLRVQLKARFDTYKGQGFQNVNLK